MNQPFKNSLSVPQFMLEPDSYSSQYEIKVEDGTVPFRYFGFNTEGDMLNYLAFFLMSLGMSQRELKELQYDQFEQISVEIKGIKVTAIRLPF